MLSPLSVNAHYYSKTVAKNKGKSEKKVNFFADDSKV